MKKHLPFSYLTKLLLFPTNPHLDTNKSSTGTYACFQIIAATFLCIIVAAGAIASGSFKASTTRLPLPIGWVDPRHRQFLSKPSTALSRALEPAHPYISFPSSLSIYVLNARTLEIHTHIHIATTDLHERHHIQYRGSSDKDTAE